MPSLTQFLRAAPLGLVLMAGLATSPALPASKTTRPEYQQEYWAEFDQRDWESAAKAAEALVAAAREQAEPPLKLAEALTLLGNAQLGKTDYVSAEAAYSEALQIVEEHAGASSASLLDPLRGMGYTLAAAGRDEEAVPYLDRALLISHRSYGLFDISQQGILRQLAGSLTKLGRTAEAARHINYLLRVGERSYGRSDPRLVPLLCSIGDWYSDTGNFLPARGSFRNALDIVEKKLGKDDLAAVQPLRGLARTYTQELFYSTLGLKTSREREPTEGDPGTEHKAINPRFISADGERALERALKILDTHPNAPRELQVDTLIQMGDWLQIKHQPDRALPFYRRAAALEDASTSGPDLAANDASGTAPEDQGPKPLSFPVRVYYPMPVLATRNLTLPADQVDERYVQVEFTVTNDGEVTDAKVTQRNGTARQATEALQAIRAARFRPKFVNGEPVATPGMTNREIFKMRKQSEGEKQGDAEEKDS